MEVVKPAVALDEKWMRKPVYIQKFSLWRTGVQKSCEAKGGPSGVYCWMRGQNCCYNMCPRRAFEEVAMDLSAIPPPPVPPKELKQQVNQQAKQIQSLTNQNKKHIKDNAELRKVLAKLQKDFNTLKTQALAHVTS